MCDDLPLCPALDGSEGDKGPAVGTIFRLVELCGSQLQDDRGSFLYGGHSLRTGGAYMLASLGVNPYKIQSLGRWRSTLVIHYAGEAMHSNIASDLAGPGAPARDELSDLVARMESRLLDLESELVGLQAVSNKPDTTG